MFEGWQFCSPFVHKDDCYFFGNLKTHINWCEKPKKFVACLTPARHSRKNAGLCTNHLIEYAQGAVFIRYHCIKIHCIELLELNVADFYVYSILVLWKRMHHKYRIPRASFAHEPIQCVDVKKVFLQICNHKCDISWFSAFVLDILDFHVQF